MPDSPIWSKISLEEAGEIVGANPSKWLPLRTSSDGARIVAGPSGDGLVFRDAHAEYWTDKGLMLRSVEIKEALAKGPSLVPKFVVLSSLYSWRSEQREDALDHKLRALLADLGNSPGAPGFLGQLDVHVQTHRHHLRDSPSFAWAVRDATVAHFASRVATLSPATLRVLKVVVLDVLTEVAVEDDGAYLPALLSRVLVPLRPLLGAKEAYWP